MQARRHDRTGALDHQARPAPRQQRLDEPQSGHAGRNLRQVEALLQGAWILDRKLHAVRAGRDLNHDAVLPRRAMFDGVGAKLIDHQRQWHRFVFGQAEAPEIGRWRLEANLDAEHV